MFNKRKKAQELQQAGQENEFSAAIDKASGLADPAERVVALQAVNDKIELYLTKEEDKLSEKVVKSKKRSGAVAGVGDLAAWGGFIGACIATGPVGWTAAGVLGGGVALKWGAKAAGKKRQEHIREKYLKANAGYTESLRELQTSIDDTINKTLVDDMEKIVESTTFLIKLGSSSAFLSRVKKIPGLSERFNAAVTKRGAQAKADIQAYMDRAEARKKNTAAPAIPEKDNGAKKIIKKIIKQ